MWRARGRRWGEWVGGGWGDWGGIGEGSAQWVLRCWEDGGRTQIVCIMVQRKRTLHDDELKVTRLYYTRIASRCYDLLVLKGKLNTDLSLAILGSTLRMRYQHVTSNFGSL